MSTSPCFLAYVDPGSGLLVWQMIVSGLLGSLFYFKKTREAICAVARRLIRRD
jgi:hypothetical protein